MGMLTFCRRIRDNDYEFPTDRSVSADAKILIQEILTTDPQKRPTLHKIVDGAFFTRGIVPASIPLSAHDLVPDFRHISRAASDTNLRRLRRHAMLDEDQITRIAVPQPPTRSGTNSNAALGKSMTSSIAQQEKEFHRAVQPGSPISALLISARQPLVMGTNADKEGQLLRKLQAVAKESPLRGRGTRALHDIAEDGEAPREKGEEDMRKKELEAQKARIVAQMVPAREEIPEPSKPRTREREQENVPPAKRLKEKEKAREIAREEHLPGNKSLSLYETFSHRTFAPKFPQLLHPYRKRSSTHSTPLLTFLVSPSMPKLQARFSMIRGATLTFHFRPSAFSLSPGSTTATNMEWGML
jgi:cell cycle serine/threonine-protein kinase CDC5/MSD2